MGEPVTYASGSPALVDAARLAAEEAFWSYGFLPRNTRAAFLDRTAEEIDARGDAITSIRTAETGLPAGRLEGERGRTTGQLKLFAAHIREGAYLDLRHDTALPERQPLPRPDLKMIQRPIGPSRCSVPQTSLSPSQRQAGILRPRWLPAPGQSEGPFGQFRDEREIVARGIDAARGAIGLHP